MSSQKGFIITQQQTQYDDQTIIRICLILSLQHYLFHMGRIGTITTTTDQYYTQCSSQQQ